MINLTVRSTFNFDRSPMHELKFKKKKKKIKREKSRAEQMTHLKKNMSKCLCMSGTTTFELKLEGMSFKWIEFIWSHSEDLYVDPWRSSIKSVTWFRAINAFSLSYTHKYKRAAVEANLLLYSNQSTSNYFSANCITMQDLRCARWDPLVHMNTFGIWARYHHN